MNQRIKKLWIKALRSGKYKQTKGRLRRDRAGDVRMCCLGVLCEIFRATEKRGQWVHSDRGWFFNVDGKDAKSVTHKTVTEWADLPDENPELGSEYASRLNDDGKDFNFIAEQIEQYL